MYLPTVIYSLIEHREPITNISNNEAMPANRELPNVEIPLPNVKFDLKEMTLPSLIVSKTLVSHFI